ncbi:hypothetical protein H634G_10935 [Metarhizium anisopliae BRIP 53293]|uniref:Uncharacterized protein n=1 Tax=Metarhizium anisopliae BRIP 53293 TaxID=1291518 RepID=A0A0D9NMF2_METAN|nr:hypothetical protein H634G_10935 [Metarhizium anisopliae BRIP 53293]KJK87392.1 hypothetical protein H633G_08751 [Metarhizium anisopliae BRIP 53284]
MRVSIIPQQTLLPQESVKLGRLITNYEYPYQDYHDPPSSQQPNLLLSFHDAYVAEHHEARVSSFGLTLTSLISARFAKHAKLKIRVNAEQLKTYALDNSEHWFEEVTRLPATRAWIERAIDKRRDIYLIVGFHTITNAKISQESARGKGDHAHIQASLAMSLVAAGVVMPLGEQINPTASLHNQNLNGAQSVFLAAGERVCAIEYRKVIHSWLSSKHIDRSRLSGVRQWPSMETTRDDEEDGEDDIVEVELAEMARPDGGWDIGVVDQDNILNPATVGFTNHYLQVLMSRAVEPKPPEAAVLRFLRRRDSVSTPIQVPMAVLSVAILPPVASDSLSNSTLRVQADL